MDYQFTSLEQLFKRIRPALHAKERELRRLGYSSINGIDVWNYLIENRWKNGEGLMLSDIVNDIMIVDCGQVDEFKRSKGIKEKDNSSFEENTDII